MLISAPLSCKGEDVNIISVSTTGLYISNSHKRHTDKFKELQLRTLQYLQKTLLQTKKISF